MEQGLVRMLFTCCSQFDSCEIKLHIMVHTSFHIGVYCLSSGQEDIFHTPVQNLEHSALSRWILTIW